MKPFIQEYKKGPFFTGFHIPDANDPNGTARLSSDITDVVEIVKSKSLSTLGIEYQSCKKAKAEEMKKSTMTPYTQLFCSEIYRTLKNKCDDAEKNGNINEIGMCDNIFYDSSI